MTYEPTTDKERRRWGVWTYFVGGVICGGFLMLIVEGCS